MSHKPLAEVFGYPIRDCSEEADHFRKLRLCPYNNSIPNCNKEKARNPLGVCSILFEGKPVIICPIRLRQNWKAITDIAKEFFPKDTNWTTVADVKLFDNFNRLIDKIDFVLVAYDKNENVVDFIAIDMLGINVQGNLRREFESYMENAKKYFSKNFQSNEITPDFTTTTHRRLAPQIIYKGSIFQSWSKKTIYVVDKELISEIPEFTKVEKERAEVSWFTYELIFDSSINNYKLSLSDVIHTLYQPTLFEVTKIEPAPLEKFISQLQEKLDEVLEKNYDAESIPFDIIN